MDIKWMIKQFIAKIKGQAVEGFKRTLSIKEIFRLGRTK